MGRKRSFVQRVPAGVLVLLLARAAFAVMPPWVYEEARETAMYHVQVKVLSVKGPAQTLGECQVTGEVARIFRDTSGALKIGAPVAFSISCSSRGDRPLVGGTLWTDYDRLMQARYLEVYLNSDQEGYRLALWQSRILDEPTETPTF